LLFFPTADEDFKYFRSQGYDGSINDMHYKAMGDLGYTGSLNNRIHAFLTANYGSFYEAMRDLRNGTSVFALYAVNTLIPPLVLDFKLNTYKKENVLTTLSSAVTQARASSATMTNSSGTLVTVGNNIPRVGHHVYNGSAWVNEGILHESEARTNLFTESEEFNTWTVGGGGSVTANQAVAPDGTTTADQASGVIYKSPNRLSRTRTFSGYIKAGTATTCQVRIDAPAQSKVTFNITNGTVTTNSGTSLDSYGIEDVGNGWYRAHITVTAAIVNAVFVPETSKTVFLWGAQLESGSTLSSYIATSGSTATRAAETLTVPAANLPYSSTNMSIQMDGKMTGNNLKHIRWFEDVDDAILLKTGTNNFTFTQEAGGTVDTVTGGSFTSGNLLAFNIASRHGSGFINGAISGTALTANTTPSALPDLADNNLVLGYDFMGTIAQFRMWDEDLTDSGIAEAST
jgi:hypothetical protein